MTDNDFTKSFKTYTSQFPRSFWIVNGLELLERGAYYGTMAILAIHLHDNLDFSAAITGMLASLLMALLYFVPLVAAALAEKIGYRITLIGAFIFMIAGYLSLGFFSDLALVIMSIIFLGIGAGTFKPLISATIAHVTEESQRNTGYAIYYWMINLGAFLVPLMIGLSKSVNLFDPEKNSELVFYLSTILISINLIIAFFKVEEPIEPDPDKDIFGSLKVLVTVFEDRQFIYLLLIYSGFWFMFGTGHTFLPIYMKHFHIMPDWFSVFYLAIINPGTIITVGFGLSKVVEKYDSLHLMITGVSIFVGGVLMLGLTSIPYLFIGGIFVFSIGEFITHPNFISYVSKIAPKDKVAVYMGYAFISTGIGTVFGNFFGGYLFGHFAENEEMPKIFWSIVACYGLITVANLVFYDIYIVGRGKSRPAGTEEIWDDDDDVEWIQPYEEEPEIERKPSPINVHIPYISDSRWSKHVPAFLALMLIPIILFGASRMGTNTYYEEDDVDVYYTESNWYVGNTQSDYTDEGDETTWPEEIDDRGIANLEFSLTWEDEDDSDGNHENQPDEFEFSVEAPWGETYDSEAESNQHGQEHTIILLVNISNTEVEKRGTNKARTDGEYIITVRCLDAGDQEYNGIPGLGSDEDDNGNDWSFTFRMTLWERHEED